MAKVGDFLGSIGAPPPPPKKNNNAGVQGEVGAPPIDADGIRQGAGAQLQPPIPADPEEPRQSMPMPAQVQVDPVAIKELEIIQLKLQLADSEEQLAVQRIQEIRRQRQDLKKILRSLMARMRGQVVVSPDGQPQTTPVHG